MLLNCGVGYGGPVLVLDFGTATTYDLIDANGTFLTGITAPGIQTSATALWEEAAKLPEIEIKKPDSILAKDNISYAGRTYLRTDWADGIYY